MLMHFSSCFCSCFESHLLKSSLSLFNLVPRKKSWEDRGWSLSANLLRKVLVKQLERNNPILWHSVVYTFTLKQPPQAVNTVRSTSVACSRIRNSSNSKWETSAKNAVLRILFARSQAFQFSPSLLSESLEQATLGLDWVFFFLFFCFFPLFLGRELFLGQPKFIHKKENLCRVQINLGRMKSYQVLGDQATNVIKGRIFRTLLNASFIEGDC